MLRISRWFIFFVSISVPIQSFSFEFQPATIPIDEIRPGGPPKDGIPALTHPEFVSADKASYLKAQDRVIGIELKGQSKAYPIKILNWHEIVNDELAGKNMVVTYCPLCGTGMIFNAKIKGEKRVFGVSGLLYNSDVLMYDKKTESLWSQLKMEGVTGRMAGQKLELLLSHVTSWGDWKARYPKTKVLSIKTGYERDYDRDPYEGYEDSEKTFFPISPLDSSRHAKEWVFGLIRKGQAKAYPFKELTKGKSVISDMIGEETIRITFDKTNRTVKAETESGKPLPGIQAYWFAWRAFYPNSAVFKAP